MKLGADRRRLAILGGLILIGGYVLYSNVFSGSGDSPSPSSNSRPAARPASEPVVATPSSAVSSRLGGRREQTRAVSGEWKPPYRSDKAINPLAVDPTLRLDLLAKVQQVALPGAQRNLFQYGAALQTDQKPLPTVDKIKMAKPVMGPQPPPAPTAPVVPTAPPITFKYYGYTNAKNDSRKRAFFLDGDEIIVASEGDAMKRGRYRLVKIGVNSVTVEDTEFKSQQTLPLVEDIAG